MKNMKKLLGAITIFAVAGSTVTTVVACGQTTPPVTINNLKEVTGVTVHLKKDEDTKSISQKELIDAFNQPVLNAVQTVNKSATASDFTFTLSTLKDGKYAPIGEKDTVDLTTTKDIYVQITANAKSKTLTGKTEQIKVSTSAKIGIDLMTFNAEKFKTANAKLTSNEATAAQTQVNKAIKDAITAVSKEAAEGKDYTTDVADKLIAGTKTGQDVTLTIEAKEDSTLLVGTNQIKLTFNLVKADLSNIKITDQSIKAAGKTLTDEEATTAQKQVNSAFTDNDVIKNLKAVEGKDYTTDVTTVLAKDAASVKSVKITINSKDTSTLLVGTTEIKVNFIAVTDLSKITIADQSVTAAGKTLTGEEATTGKKQVNKAIDDAISSTKAVLGKDYTTDVADKLIAGIDTTQPVTITIKAQDTSILLEGTKTIKITFKK